MKKNYLLLLLVLALMIAGCSTDNRNLMVEGKVNVITSFYPLYDFTVKIGGDYVNAINLVPAGVEPHDWTPKARDMVNITKSDVFIYNGADFEGWVQDFLDTLDAADGPVVIAASAGVKLIDSAEHEHGDGHDEHDEHADEHDHGHAEEDDEHADEHEHADDHEHGDFDPHVWLSPKQAMLMAAAIRDALVEADPAHADAYHSNYDDLSSRLAELDAELTRIATNSTKKEFVVSHESFGYLARDYGLVQVAVMGLSPDAEPTVRRMQEIKQFVEEHDIQYILFEELVSSKLAETLANSLNIKTMVLNPLEGLTEEQQRAGEDYISIMKSNLTTLEKALK